MMRKETLQKIEVARKNGIGINWEDPMFAPVSWSTMKKYPDIFEIKVEYFTCENDYEEWISEIKMWKFR